MYHQKYTLVHTSVSLAWQESAQCFEQSYLFMMSASQNGGTSWLPVTLGFKPCDDHQT